MAGLAVTEFLIFKFFLSSATYEEGNEAKLKREFFSTQLMKSLPFHLSNGIAW